MLDALQPFLEDKKQTLALNGGDDPIRLILAYFSTDNQNIDELEKLKYNKALYRRLGWQDEEWFDVISSFYQVYCCGLAWVCSGKTCNDYGADWSDLDGGDLPPLPRTEEELTECLDEMIKRIRVRACRLSGIPD